MGSALVLFWCEAIKFNSLFYYKMWHKFYDYAHQNGGPWTAAYNNDKFSDIFLTYNVSEKSFICDRTVKLNGQSETFACVLAMGHHWRCTHKYMYLQKCSVDNIKQRIAWLIAVLSSFTCVHLMIFFTTYHTDYAYVNG